MKYIRRYSANIIDPSRLDTDYYVPSAINALEFIKKLNPIELDKKGDVWCFGAYELCNKIQESNNSDDPVFIKISDIKEPFIDIENSLKVTIKTHNLLKNAHIEIGDIIVSISGTIGTCAILSKHSQKGVSANQAIAKYRCKEVDPYFVVAYFISNPFKKVINREAGGAVQKNLYLYNFTQLPLIIPDRPVQTYIGDKVRQAERLRVRAKELNLVIKEKMKLCFRGQPKPEQNKHSIVQADRLSSNRLEPDFYTPLVLWAEEEIQNTQWTYQLLSEIAHRIKDGPGGWGVSTDDYVSSGIPVIRAVNLIDGECDLSECVFISPQKHRKLISHKVKQQSVLLSVRGTIGRAAVFSSGKYEEASLNAAVVTIDCKDDVIPHYLAEFLNTEIGRIQSNRMANGAVQLNMNLQETGNNLVVIPPQPFQEKIAELRKIKILTKELAKNLTTTAKLLVEALIEGKISEEEMKNAQEALEKGNHDLDRSILARMTRKGLDMPDEPPLFPDLDVLYEAIQNSQEGWETKPLQ